MTSIVAALMHTGTSVYAGVPAAICVNFWWDGSDFYVEEFM